MLAKLKGIISILPEQLTMIMLMAAHKAVSTPRFMALIINLSSMLLVLSVNNLNSSDMESESGHVTHASGEFLFLCPPRLRSNDTVITMSHANVAALWRV